MPSVRHSAPHLPPERRELPGPSRLLERQVERNRQQAAVRMEEMPTEDVPEWLEFDYSLRPATAEREDLSHRTSARVGEQLDPNTGKYVADVDEEGFEWIIPSATSNASRPYSHAVGYNAQEHKIRIMFREGSPASHGRGTWRYDNVSAAEWYELRRRASTGRYMIKHILDHPNGYEDFPYPF